MKEETRRLNPFTYISETDIRFYSLVLAGIIMPSFWAISLGIIIFSALGGLPNSLFLRLLIAVIILSFIPLIIYCHYRRSPGNIIKKLKLKEFNPEKFPDHSEYIETLYGKYLSGAKRPTLMYQPLDSTESSFTFGTKNHLHIGLSGGLIRKFRNNIDGFRSILLHELGHIVNKDVEKAYLATSTWWSLRFTLSIPLGIFVLGALVYASIIFFGGILTGDSMDYAASQLMGTGAAELLPITGGIIGYFVFFLVTVYVLRGQIIRLREFYADAKILEWEKSPEAIAKTLEEFSGQRHSTLELLSKFHPNISERIHLLHNNSGLFTPSSWIAFAIGFSYCLIERSILPSIMTIFSIERVTDLQDTGTRAFISLIIFPVIMLAVSSSFHKSTLKDVFIDNRRYFSTATVLKAIKFSMVFGLGYTAYLMISFIPHLYRYSLLGTVLEGLVSWIFHTAFLFIVLIFLLIFASMLIRRSFSMKAAQSNFLTVTIFSSVLYIANRFLAIELIKTMSMPIVFFLIFSVVIYIFIKIKDGRLSCPHCGSKISKLPGRKLNCPECHQNLYSWAIYSF